MPAKSQAQRGYLASHFGAGWMREHGFDNKGKLPARVGKKKAAKKATKKKPKKRKPAGKKKPFRSPGKWKD